MKPDNPRTLKSGALAKYEMPGNERMVLDVPPAVQRHIGNPKIPLFATEGIKKGDALASVGACVVTILGVTCWRGTNEHGGKTSLADWSDVALNDRAIYIVFDSDVMRKRSVYMALVAIREWLASRGGEGHHPEVYLIYLPNGPQGEKQGVDDYLAAGHTLDDLMQLATTELREPPTDAGDPSDEAQEYVQTESGIVWNKPGQEGTTPVPLTNFTAKIVEDVYIDDGAETQQEYRIEARYGSRSRTFAVPFSSFGSMQWPSEHLGAGASVYPGIMKRDHAQFAIRTVLSGDVPQTRIFAHTGWRQMEAGNWVYLHAGGAIGATDADRVRVRLSGVMERFILPVPPQGGDLQNAVAATLALLDLGPSTIMFPLLSAIFRAPLGPADFSLALTGQTGTFKSELTALAQQHFGAGMNRTNLPGSWSSTENALEGMAFLAKDMVFAIDDFIPTGSDAQRLHAKADRVLRSQGNGSGRQRMNADTTLRAARPPRCLIFSTGEDVPQGHSLRARLFILDVRPNDIKMDCLTACQRDAAAGVYAATMAGFVDWLAPQYEELRKKLPEWQIRLRDSTQDGTRHRRTPAMIADLLIGLKQFLRFAEFAGAITAAQRIELEDRGDEAVRRAAQQQAIILGQSDPVQKFLDLLSAAIAGKRAHVAGVDGHHPSGWQRWGWSTRTIGTGEYVRDEFVPHKECIGFVEGSDLYLIPEMAHSVACRLSADNGEPFNLAPTALWKRLNEAKLLLTTDKPRSVLTVRKMLQGTRRNVLHISARCISEKPDQPDQPDQSAADWSDFEAESG